jgi:hypothetical protein
MFKKQWAYLVFFKFGGSSVICLWNKSLQKIKGRPSFLMLSQDYCVKGCLSIQKSRIFFRVYTEKDKTHRRQCRQLIKLTCKGKRGFATGVYLSEAQNPIPPPPPYTLFMWLYTVYLFTQGRGGRRVEPERRGERQQFAELGRKYQHDWLYLQSINSYKHLPLKSLWRSIFLDDHILLWCLYSN